MHLYFTYVGERVVVLMGMGGEQPPYICFENNGGMGTMGKEFIVLNNGKEQWERTMERVPIVLDNRLKEQCSTLIWGTMAINSRQ
jgi:hypothetical protein